MKPLYWLLCVLMGVVLWLLLAWSLADKGDVRVLAKAEPSQQNAQHVRTAQVHDLWLTLHERAVLDEFLREHHRQERLKAERARAAVRRKAAVRPTVRAAGTGGVNWDAIARCESNGRWNLNTGNGYYGGLQFALSSWRGVGGTGYPHHHSRETQIAMAMRLSNGGRNLGHWPACGRFG